MSEKDSMLLPIRYLEMIPIVGVFFMNWLMFLLKIPALNNISNLPDGLIINTLSMPVEIYKFPAFTNWQVAI